MSSMSALSKSDFLLAQTCPAKLYYKKMGYPSILDDDEYLQFLADGGYMIEKIAKLLHPGGVEMGFSHGAAAAVEQTLRALQADTVTLFEATLTYGNLFARMDILKKQGDAFDLIEVKAKLRDSTDADDGFRGKRGGIKSEWRPYLEDVTFQTIILKKLFPAARITPYLCLPDKSKTTTIDLIFDDFKLIPPDSPPLTGFRKPTVEFTGDVAQLRANHFLSLFDVTDEVNGLSGEVEAKAAEYAASLSDGVKKIPTQIDVNCRACEYRVTAEQAGAGENAKNGFKECWGELADASPHILDMYQASRIGGAGGTRANDLIRQSKVGLFDLQEDDLKTKKGEVGALDQRRRIQRRYTLENQEWIGEPLADILRGHAYPLHFIDFETSRLAVPYHAGMRPYEQVGFQWSCHTLREPGAEIEHGEWINLDNAFPNFGFARSLMQAIGDVGTVFTWSHHENSVLKDIHAQLQRRHHHDPELTGWLEAITAGARIVDLCDVAKKHYFHPKMKGRLSLKYVLPAVWNYNPYLHAHPLFKKYYAEQNGVVLSPYDTLQPLPFGNDSDESEEVVKEGTGAMRAYQEMLYGVSKHDPDMKGKWKQLLLQYCELDTAAMVIVWWHWCWKCGIF